MVSAARPTLSPPGHNCYCHNPYQWAVPMVHLSAFVTGLAFTCDQYPKIPTAGIISFVPGSYFSNVIICLGITVYLNESKAHRCHPLIKDVFMCNAPRHRPDMASTLKIAVMLSDFLQRRKLESYSSPIFSHEVFLLEFNEGDRSFLQTIALLFAGCDTPALKIILKGEIFEGRICERHSRLHRHLATPPTIRIWRPYALVLWVG